MDKYLEPNEASHGTGRYSRLALISLLCTIISITALWLQLLMPYQGPYYFSIISAISAIIGILTAIFSILMIRKNRHQLRGVVLAGIVIVLDALLISPLVLCPVLHIIIARHNDRRWAGLNQIEELGRALDEYEKAHGGYLPDANSWCDELIDECKWLSIDYFTRPLRERHVCDFAFNSAVSGLPIHKIDPDVVLLFEAEGPWNLNGGPELLIQRKNLDTYILLISGNAYRYNFAKRGIEWYDANSEQFYVKPLIWEPTTKLEKR